MSGNIPSTTLDEVDVTASAATPAGNNPTAATAIYQPQAAIGGDDLTLSIGNMSWSGWQRVQVTRSMDTVPANFNIMLTERYPNMPDIDIKPGAACTVQIGGDLVLTGFVDRYGAVVNARAHTVTISGRSKSQDLVDCAAFVGGQGPSEETYVLHGTPLAMITQLAQAYGITVNNQSLGAGSAITALPINLGETAWELIDRLTKMAQVVAYDMPDGSIMLAQAGKEQMASGFTQGVNVEEASVAFTMDQRFSVYEGFQTPTVILNSTDGGHMPPQAIAYDGGVPRFRKRIIIAEQPGPDKTLLQQRVQWEANRRAGRSLAVTITCDSWRDTANNLWAPNHMAPIDIPSVKVPNTQWCIGQVTYLKDERGRHAIVLLMPASAFQPEPVAPLGSYPTAQSLGISPSNPTAANPSEIVSP